MSERRFIYGFHSVTAKLRHSPDDVAEIFIDRNRQDARARDLIKLAELHDVRLIPADPARLDGMAGANWILSGVAIAPISLRTCAIRSLRKASLAASP